MAVRSARSWSYGPISTAFSSLKTTGDTTATPGTSNLEVSLAGWGWPLRTLGVMRRSEPTTNLVSAAFAAS